MGTRPLTALARLRQVRLPKDAVRRWRHPPVVLAAALVGAVASVHAHPAPSAQGKGLVISIALAGFIVGALAVASTVDRLSRLLLGATAFMFASSAVLLGLQPRGSTGMLGAVLALAIVALRLRGATGVAVGLSGILALALVVETSQHRSFVASVLACFPAIAIFWLVFLFARLREAKERAEALLADLEESRSAEARSAALAERHRLAREMHDILAHSLSALMLQLEGARMLAASNPADPRLPEAVGRAHELAKDGVHEARHAIAMLRGDELPGSVALETLTDQFEGRTGISCSCGTSGQPRSLRADARLALYRVTQEALTNVIKHSAAERVEVGLVYAVDQVRLTIEDFRAACTPAAAGNGTSHVRPAAGSGSGYGLTGMRERAELLGGTLTASATPTGFRVELQVPA